MTTKPGRRGPTLIPGGGVLVATKLPVPVHDALRAAAAATYESPSAWVRRVVIERLRTDGVLPPIVLPQAKDL